jgi:hypothetical protein
MAHEFWSRARERVIDAFGLGAPELRSVAEREARTIRFVLRAREFVLRWPGDRNDGMVVHRD